MKAKKLLALTLVLILALSCMSITAFAANEYEFDSITLYKTEVSLVVGYKFGLTETIHDKNQGNIPAGTVTVNWSSSDETVATVSDDGVVKAVKSGTATISAVPNGYEEDNTNGNTPLKATCTVTVVDAILDLESDATYSDTATVDQTYTATVNTPKTDKTKVQVSWKLEGIAATVTVNKKWNTDTLTWDTTSTTDSAEGATAEFTFMNLSSVKVAASVSFTAESAFANASGKTDKYTESFAVDGSAADEAETIISSIIADRENAPEAVGTTAPTAKIEYTITPQSGAFTHLTADQTKQTFGTYTVTISDVFSVSCSIAGVSIDKSEVVKGKESVVVNLTGTLPDMIGTRNAQFSLSENKLTLSDITDDVEIAKADYLTFTAIAESSSVTPNSDFGTVDYSTDGGKTWTEAANGTAINITNGNSICMKKHGSTAIDTSPVNHFSMSGKIAASGSVTSLTDGLGSDANVVLSRGCYSNMFYDCTSLTTAPKLPATRLAQECYVSMFQNCSALVSAPELPATEMAIKSYFCMFNKCISLTEAPILPATELAKDCYSQMFLYCSALVTPPELPATTLAENCYGMMFASCTSLTSAPEMRATDLPKECYIKMFFGCSTLKITTNGTLGTVHGVIFSGAKTVDSNSVKSMFAKCAEAPADVPTFGENTTYYWYIEN